MNTLRLYGADWCPDCRRAKAYLKENNIPFDFIDVDLDESATRLVETINNGKRIIPTIDLNGTTYTNPNNAELADALGINDAGVVQLFGADWCPDCRRAKSYLADNGVNFQFIDVDEHEWATDAVEKINNGKRIIPTILIDGKPHTNPDNATLKTLLNIDVKKEHKVYDTIIIGGGAAGLTTAIYAQRDRFDTIILEKKTIGGNAFLTQTIENYPGFTNISGPDLMDKMEAGARADTKPPDFNSDPSGAYDYLRRAYDDLIDSRDKIKEQNKALRSMVVAHRTKDEEELEKQSGLAILNMASGETKGPSRVPPYYGTEGGHSAQIWITGLEKLQGVQKWSDKQTLDAADLALFGIAAEWKAAQMEANTEVFQDLKLFKAAFVKRFAIQQSSVESIKLVMELKQKTDEKVRDFYDRVFNVIMYFGRERKLEMTAAGQQDGFKHLRQAPRSPCLPSPSCGPC